MKKPLQRLMAFNLCFVLFSTLISLSSYAVTKTSTGDGSWSQNGTWSPAGEPVAGDDVIIAAGHTVVLNTDATGLNSLTINGTLTAGNNNTDRLISVLGSVTINTGGVFNTAGNGGNRLFLTGNLVVDGTLDANLGPGSMDITFNGNSASQSVTGTGIVDFNGITLFNSLGLSLGLNADLRGIINFVNGIISIQPGFTLHNINGTIATSGGFNNVEHINTQVNYTTGAQGIYRVSNLAIGVAYTFPVGNGTYYMPVTVTPVSALSSFSVNVFSGITAEGTPNGTPFTAGQKNYVVDAVWDVERISGSGNADITLGWENPQQGPGFSTLSDAQIGISRHDGTSWTLTSGSGSQAANTATRTGMSAFGSLGVGQNATVLPLHFANIKAFQKNGGVQIEWSNMTEKDVDHYTVERSADGVQFTSIGQTAARSNTESRQDYTVFDAAPIQGVNFYRIRGIEINNRASFSPIVKVEIGGTGADIRVYPNPVRGMQLSLQFTNIKDGQYTLSLVNTNGQQVFRKTLLHQGGSRTESLELPGIVKPGVYTLLVTGEGFKESRPLIIQ
ncbi:MAG TPA: T9SS type A sorting domain-containing protein [Chitinophagaceae bacterium]|nr:T9SS type A sorting domain-containing protein [Chitinophagaceae bacterium]